MRQMASPLFSKWPDIYTFGDGDIEIPKVTTASIIGITVAICGNVIISLALNFQKLAHRRLDREKALNARERELVTQRNSVALNESVEEGGSHTTTTRTMQTSLGTNVAETAPLLQHSHSDPSSRKYGTTSNSSPGSNNNGSRAIPPLTKPDNNSKYNLISRLIPFPFHTRSQNTSLSTGVRGDITESCAPHSTHIMLPVQDISDFPLEHGAAGLQNETGKRGGNGKNESMIEHGNESDYLKSKLWWLGFLLMNIGECGNFISYAFAPASVVAPLGTFALIANCVFAPLMLNERFRKRDLIGIVIATLGAITVVLASNTSDVRLDPAGLQRAISQRPFIIFACIYILAAIVLTGLSEGEIGRRVVFVDVGLCAIFGGFTVLSTKGISTLLTLEWWDMFTEWITYPVVLVLVLTGVGQIRYLNRALKRFDSKVIIPIQFVLFTLSAIIGSAILYGDFKETNFHQLLTFLYGCVATFLGVFVIAWAPSEKPILPDFDYEQNSRDRDLSGLEGGDGAGSDRAERTMHTGGSTGGVGATGRRRASAISPVGSPIVRNRPSVIGLSPAQHLLLVHTPPQDRTEHWDREVDASPTQDSLTRPRAISWLGEERPPRSVVVRREDGTDENLCLT